MFTISIIFRFSKMALSYQSDQTRLIDHHFKIWR